MSEMINVEELFGSRVFTLGKMKERLTRQTFAEVKRVMEQGGNCPWPLPMWWPRP